MATKWAVANGNWNAGATWNGGVVPADGDVVYCNGHTITANVNIAIGQGTIRNDANADLGVVAGGYLLLSITPMNITANLYAESTYLLRRNTSLASLTITGNITPPLNNVSLCTTQYNASTSVTLNGNINANGRGGACFNWGFGTGSLSINGNINGGNNYIQTDVTSLTINGNVVGGGSDMFNVTTSLILGGTYMGNGARLCRYINGIATLNGNVIQKANTNVSIIDTARGLVIGGNIGYSGNNLGVSGAYYSVVDPNFRWYCVDDSPSLPFEIIKRESRVLPQESDVLYGVPYGTYDVPMTGTYTPDYPQEANVLQGVTYDNGNKTGTLTPVILGDYPAEADVKVGIVFDYGNKVGTFQPVADYPAEADVLQGVEYAYGQMTGTLSVAADYPQEANVLLGVEYANGSMVGTLEVVQMQADYPSEDDVRFDVVFDFGNKLGKCHVPIPEDVRDGVPVDVNGVGTLIPSSGGDRLRIADFGYYTRSTSITYIVDLTESDKPAFADCEEIVLRSLFPTLDLDNIPDKFFDDLFVQFLRYRLLVEYYRGTSINSKFTPSEPTTEIVNYANTKCEYWLNTANLFLQLWGEKYPNSVKRDRILL